MKSIVLDEDFIEPDDSGDENNSLVYSSDEEKEFMQNIGDDFETSQFNNFFNAFDMKFETSSEDGQPTANETNVDSEEKPEDIEKDDDMSREKLDFYDSGADSADEEYVKQYMRVNGEIETDAQLTCPNCFVLICLDCQQHETEENLYRAILVFNCVTSKQHNFTDGNVFLREVTCKQCNTALGFKDKHGIYELYNVLPSPP